MNILFAIFANCEQKLFTAIHLLVTQEVIALASKQHVHFRRYRWMDIVVCMWPEGPKTFTILGPSSHL